MLSFYIEALNTQHWKPKKKTFYENNWHLNELVYALDFGAYNESDSNKASILLISLLHISIFVSF